VVGRRTRCWSGEEGFTLAEMMISIFVVGFVLSGLAAVLLTSLKAATSNERETRATSYAQQEVEILQSVDWEFAGLYANDIAAAPAGWTDQLSASGYYDGYELITLPGPASAASRVDSVPPPRSTIVDRGVTYTIDRFITWIDRDGDGAAETRRFTVVTNWDDREASRGISITAERAPTQGDTEATSAGGRVLQMSLDPNAVELADDQSLVVDPSRGIEVRVILNQPATAGSTKVHYYSLDATNQWVLEEATVKTLDPIDAVAVAQNGAAGTRFKFSIPSTARMVEGTQDVLFIATVDGQKVYKYATLTLVGGDLGGTNPTPPAPEAPDPSPLPVIPKPDDGDDDATPPTDQVSIISATPNALCVNSGTWIPASNFAITINGEGLTSDDGTITVSYQYRTKRNSGNGSLATATESATFTSGALTSSQWGFSIPTGTNRLFSPGSTVTFTIRASRADGSNATVLRNVVVGSC
jgi:type II secretory pathway pseudopilin PulG